MRAQKAGTSDTRSVRAVARGALVLTCAAGLVATAVAAGARLEAGRFSAGSLEGWVAKRFKGETVYALRGPLDPAGCS